MPRNWCKDLNFLDTIILGTWNSLDVQSSLFAEINLSVILIVGGPVSFILFKIPPGTDSSSCMVCPSRISRMWQRQSEAAEPASSVKPDRGPASPRGVGGGMGFVYILPKPQYVVHMGSPSAALQGLSKVGHPP